MWGYYDESGEYDSGGRLLNMTVGGCFAPIERWRALDSEWGKILSQEGLSYFHMTEFESWTDQFDFRLPDGTRDKEKHNRILNSLLEIILDHVEGFYGYGAVSMFDPARPELTHRRLLEDCFAGAIKHAVLIVSDFYHQPLHLVFARQPHMPDPKIRGYINSYDYGADRIETSVVANPRTVRPLQVADIFAYEMARAQRAGRPERYPFQRLVDGAKARNLQLSMFWGPVRSGHESA